MSVRMIRCGAVLYDRVAAPRKIAALPIQGVQYLKRRPPIHFLLCLRHACRQLQKPSRDDGSPAAVLPRRLFRLPEIHRDKTGICQIRHTVMSHPFCRMQICLFSCVAIAYHKSVNRPAPRIIISRIIPRPDIFSNRIKTACQKICRMQRSPARAYLQRPCFSVGHRLAGGMAKYQFIPFSASV